MSPNNWLLSPVTDLEFAGALACNECLRHPECGSDDDGSQPSCSMDGRSTSIDTERECYSQTSFEDYDYEQELDKWLEADPLSSFPDFRDALPAPAEAISQHSVDARLISEALDEPCELTSLLETASSDDDEHDPEQPSRSAADKESEEDIARLLLCSTAETCPSFVPVPPALPPVPASVPAPIDSCTRGSGSTCESASNSPRCGQSAAFTASSKLVQQQSQPAAPAPTTMFSHKSGGPCDHCGATESPQWRRGPPAKPMLCNACGTRYRRTHQLGSYPGRGGKGGSLPGRKRRATARVECRLHKQPKASLVVCAA